jgi:hypothetical protein
MVNSLSCRCRIAVALSKLTESLLCRCHRVVFLLRQYIMIESLLVTELFLAGTSSKGPAAIGNRLYRLPLYYCSTVCQI